MELIASDAKGLRSQIPWQFRPYLGQVKMMRTIRTTRMQAILSLNHPFLAPDLWAPRIANPLHANREDCCILAVYCCTFQPTIDKFNRFDSRNPSPAVATTAVLNGRGLAGEPLARWVQKEAPNSKMEILCDVSTPRVLWRQVSKGLKGRKPWCQAQGPQGAQPGVVVFSYGQGQISIKEHCQLLLPQAEVVSQEAAEDKHNSGLNVGGWWWV